VACSFEEIYFAAIIMPANPDKKKLSRFMLVLEIILYIFIASAMAYAIVN
jgi:hypothetical protein